MQVIEFGAVITAAIFGIMLARRARMDVLGVFVLAFATAFGGGTLRDLLLGRHPLFWISNSHYPVILFALVLASMFVPRIPERFKLVLHLPDAIGMGMFSVVGTQYAIDDGTTWFIASLFGVMTGCFGGVISEIISNEVPSIFRSAPLYATCSFTGCWCYMGLAWLGVMGQVCVAVAVVVIVAMRLAALYWDIRLPEYSD